MTKPIQISVTQPALPPLEEFVPYLQQIWKSKWLTNQGPFHEQFEKELADYLGVKYISLFTNGTLALITALKALNISGEVITTPFSFVATTHSIWWNNLKPVFVDIERKYLNIDTTLIESAITPVTSAILPVHVYGNPCDAEKITEIARKYQLKVIYDAAHAFGVKKEGQSILNFGDLSILSFHATKVFNTIEGGAIVSHDEKMKHHIDNLKNFGYTDETVVEEPGINAKMNELQAAYGLLQIKYVNHYISKRKLVTLKYRQFLSKIPGIQTLQDIEHVTHNYAYFPVIVHPDIYGKTRDELYYKLQEYDIFGRRYFYPLISEFPMYCNLPTASKENIPVASEISGKVICLPIYPDLDLDMVTKITGIIRDFRR